MPHPRTLADLLLSAAASYPTHGLTFVEGERSLVRSSFPSLLDQARTHLAALRSFGARKGSEVVIAVALPRTFLPVYWACQLGGMIAVPVAPLQGAEDRSDAQRLEGICRILRSPVVICDSVALDALQATLAQAGVDARVVAADALDSAGVSDDFDPGTPEDLAMIQFSSGSTREPKGACLRHRNLIANCVQMTSRAALTCDDVEAGWMPLFHDMGLIGCHIAMTMVGANQVKLPTLAFLKNPASWLEVAARAGATLLAGTNTALRLLLRRVGPQEAARYDLRSVRNFLIGAEPVFPSVLRATQQLLGPAGLRETALRVAYGLAECCVGVGYDSPDRSFSCRVVSRKGLGERSLQSPDDSSDAYELADVGIPYDDCEVRIVDDDDRDLGDGNVGHLQVRGPQVMAGYYRDDEATNAAFCGTWLRTGDLGYLLQGRFGICGRTKETLIIAGRNVFASDVESLAAEVQGVQSAVIAPVDDPAAATECAAMFVVLADPQSPLAPQVLEAARRKVQRAARLPIGWIVPVRSREIPRTSSGKVRRLLMAERLRRGEYDDRVSRVRAALFHSEEAALSSDELQGRLREVWAKVLRMPAAAIGLEDSFLELGGSSIAAVEMLGLVETELATKLGQDLLLECSSIRQMAAWIRARGGQQPGAPPEARSTARVRAPIAITALACRLPGADDPESFYASLMAGSCQVRPIPSGRMGPSGLSRFAAARGAFLSDPYAFDPAFFGIGEAEALVIDPQQRLVLELAAEALERAGLGVHKRRDLRIGTFLGVSGTPYRNAMPSPTRSEELLAALQRLPAFQSLPNEARQRLTRELDQRARSEVIAPTALVGNLLNMVAARLAHAFDLTGPAIAIDTACSSSLVAIHLACSALHSGDCDVAIAGGIHLGIDPDVWHFLHASGALSPSGSCTPFGQSADGIVPGEGAALVVLRRREDAARAGDPVRGWILGSAIGSDGRALSPMAPNPRGQRATLLAAYRDAAVDPRSICAVETHGTGTVIGDPIEIGVLNEVFAGSAEGSIAFGSVKSNLGHLLAAAGVAGMLKMILALEKRTLPPTLHAEPPNPRLALRGSPLHLAHHPVELQGSAPLRGAVSAFGFGGTNAHVVIERDETCDDMVAELPAFALPLSAPTGDHLQAWAKALSNHAIDARVLARELGRGRTAFATRAAAVLRSGQDAAAALDSLASGNDGTWLQGVADCSPGQGSAVLMFPGQGAQALHQARGLIEAWPGFRATFSALLAAAQVDQDLFAACYGDHATDQILRRTDLAQPLLVAFQIALARWVIAAGVGVAGVVGHSVGEISAAAIAGVIEDEVAVRWAAERGRLMQQCRAGAMIAVAASAEVVAPFLVGEEQSISIAGLNSHAQTVVSGDDSRLSDLAVRLENQGVGFVRVPVQHGFHSPLMRPILGDLERAAREMVFAAPTIPIASTLLGRFAAAGEMNHTYWRDHALLPVRFEEALRAMSGELPTAVRAGWFLEVGPGTTLSKLARRILGREDRRTIVSLCRNPSGRDDAADLVQGLTALASGWVAGSSLDWSLVQPPSPGSYAYLPCIPFKRKHLRLDSPPAPRAARLLHRVVWDAVEPAESELDSAQTWLVVGAGQPLVQALRRAGCKAISACAGNAYERTGDEECVFDPRDPAQWSRAQHAFDTGCPVARWLVIAPSDPALSISWIHACATAAPRPGSHPALWVVSDASALDHEACAVVATFAGAAVEELGARGRSIEVAGPLDAEQSQAIVAELRRPGPTRIRLGEQRRAPRVVPAGLPAADDHAPMVRAGGNYLVIGGTGGIGSLIARRIARQGGNVVVASRSAEGIGPLLEELRSLGVMASHVAMDVRSDTSVRAGVARTLEEFGCLRGVVFGAGIASGTPLSMADPSEVALAIRTKATGAANLARALEGLALDWVVLLSSVSAILPALGRGLASYAAANAALDSLALRMRAAGAPWISLSFGMWRGVGMGNRPGLLEAVQHAGGRALDPEEALDALELAVTAGVAHLVVTDPDDHRVTEPARPSIEARPPTPPASRRLSALPEPLAEPSDESIESFLRRRIARATGLPPTSIDPHASFASLGLDSLASVEIARELEKRLGRTLSPTVLFENDTLARLLSSLGNVQPAAAIQAPSRAPELPEVFPLMPAQATFLAQQEFHPEIPSYVFLRVDLQGIARTGWFDEALRALASRHGMLRVVFDWQEGKPVHRTVDCPPPAMEILDLQAASEHRESEIARFEHAFRNRTFDLAAAPAWRVALVRRGLSESSLLFSAHHILFDAWSAQLFLTELLEAHEAFRKGLQPAWKPLASTFADCVDAYLHAQEANDQVRAFWAEELRDAPAELSLPFDGDPSALPVGPCGLIETCLDDDATSALEGLARGWNVSVFHIIFASYLACLRRWSGTEDVPIRVAQARREGHLRDIDAVLGSFADSLPVRVLEPPGQAVRAIAQGVKARMLEVQRHAAISSLDIANLHGHRSSAGPRGVSPAGLSFPAFPTPERIGDLVITRLRGGAVSGFTQLGLIVYRSCSSLHFSWNFHETLFSPRTVDRLASEHLSLLEGLSREGTIPSASTDLSLSDREQGQGQRPALLHHKVVAAIEHGPERIAIGGARPMTYGELGERSAAVASALIEDGTGAGDLVAVLGNPQAETIAGVLGVLRSGAGYLPLDPAYPRRRIADIIAHARIRTLVTTAEHLPLIEQARSGRDRVLLLDDPETGHSIDGTLVPWRAIRALPSRSPRKEASSESIAYVMYTSGTTGHPKGVMVAHRAVASFHSWVEREFRVTAEDRFIPTSSLAFGASLRQVFSPLMAGGRVVPASPSLIRDPVSLAAFLQDEAITFWNSVPTLWATLLDAIDEREREGLTTPLQALRFVLIGGEDLPATLVRRWMARFGTRHRIFNLFGCAETIVNSVVHELKARPAESETTIPIGKARPGTTAFVLDAHGNPCRPGEAGILHIGGEALAEGYLHEPELTRAAFPATRWGRLYRTGDLARSDSRGVITYLGRSDDRVKIRGNRVELSEIEGTLRNHANVRDAACVAFAQDERQWLVAFVITGADARPGWESSLRDWVARTLPPYMVPHRFLAVGRFPLNANGKVDRRALVESLRSTQTAPPDAERQSPTETVLLEVWKAVLGNPAIGRDQDFFEAGGDSILAIEMFRRLRGRLPVVPRPVVIYAERTIAKLARAIDQLASSPQPLTPSGERHPLAANQQQPVGEAVFPLSPAQTGFLFLEQGGTDAAPVWFADIPVEADLDPERFSSAMKAVAQRHPMLRTAFKRDGARWQQQILDEPIIPLEVMDQVQPPAGLDELWSGIRSTRFDLGRPPLFRMVIARTGPRSWRCLMAVHHIIGDAWSLRLVLQDLATAYAGQALPPLHGSYADVVAWHSGHDSHRKESMAWWRKFFLQTASSARLPAADGDTLTDTVALTVDAATTERLRSIARSRSTTLHACVLTLWLSCLREVTGVGDLTVGTASSGREIPVPGVDSIVGCLATTLPVRARLSGSFDEDLRAVSAAWEQAFAHGDVPVYEAWLSAGAPRDPSVPGMGLYFSYMEFKPLTRATDSPLRFDLSAARLHFAAESADHEAMLTVLVDDTIRLQLRGNASAGCLRDLSVRMQRALRSLSWDTTTRAFKKTAEDAAIVAYLPSLATLLEGREAGLDPALLRTQVLNHVFPGKMPRWLESRDTSLGRTGAVFLPLFADELASIPPETLAGQVAGAVRVAMDRGAAAVSLAGVLPSLTSYGHSVRRLLPPDGGALLTTGHAATVAAVVGTLRSAMAALGRSWTAQQVAIVGFGSMGQGIAALLLSALGRPRSLVVCDRQEALGSIEDAVRELESAFGSAVSLVGSTDAGLPDAVYDCDVVVGATNRGGVLDVARLKDGAVLADDSFPPIYDRARVTQEVFVKHRVLVVGAGRLAVEGSESDTEALGLPPALESLAHRSVQESGTAGMPGCRVEALLVAQHGLKPLTGLVTGRHAFDAWALLARLGVDSAPLHLGSRLIPQEVLAAVASRLQAVKD